MKIRYTGEDFEYHWGFIDWKNKVVLDIGADYGSTAECFLSVGASKVYASEGDEKLYNQLVEYAKDKPNIIPNRKWIGGPTDFIDLFNNFKTDIVKIDCEGAEEHLLGVPDDILRSNKEYVIECHGQEPTKKISEKLRSLKFDIVETRPLIVIEGYNIVYAANRG